MSLGIHVTYTECELYARDKNSFLTIELMDKSQVANHPSNTNVISQDY